MNDWSKEYESSLKSLETENWLDRIFYRPAGFAIARLLRHTGITPNMVTIVSILVGGSVGWFFYSSRPIYHLYGILLLIGANILDCVDGQLARMTGVKSAIGRILDGVAGDIWFASIYIGLALRLQNQFDWYWIFFVVLSGFSHLVQANLTDYYKTLHLFFISKEKGAEFQSLQQIRETHRNTAYGLTKLFYFLYLWYSTFQIKATPVLQEMLQQFYQKYGNNLPENLRLELRQRSKRIMRMVDLLTFNGRTVVLFILVLTDWVWLYFIYEAVVLNFVLWRVKKKHESMCAVFLDK